MPVEIDISDKKAESVIVSAVNVATVFSLSQQPGELSNLEYSNSVAVVNVSVQNAVVNQQSLNQLGVSVLGKAVALVATVTPMQAKAATEILTGDSPAEELAALQASVNASSSSISPIGPTPVTPLIPPLLPSGTIYARAPIHLVYNNTDGIANVTGIVEL